MRRIPVVLSIMYQQGKTFNPMIRIITGIFMILLTGCSEYDEILSEDFPAYTSLTPENIETSLPVIHVEVDQGDFDHMYENYLDDIQIYGDFHLFREGQWVLRDMRVRLQIKGAASAAYPLKSLGLRFDDMVCNRDRQLINPRNTLPFHNIDEIEIFRLRNSGNDFYHTMIKDLSYTQMAIEAGLDLDLMYSEQAVAFVNGQFFGVMNMRTEGNTRGMAGLYGVPKSSVTLAKIVPDGETVVMDGDYQRIENLLDAIRDRNLPFLQQAIELEHFIDYMIYQSYVANRDWPHNNVRIYAIDDAPFRFVMFDLDLCNTINIDHSPLDFIYNGFPNPVTQLFDVFYAEESFREAFYLRYDELLNSGMLTASRFYDISLMHYQHIEAVMPYQIQRYGIPGSMAEWYRNLELMHMLFEEREQYVKKRLNP